MIDKNEIELIINQLKNEIVPIGSVLIFSSEKVPDNYLPCDGRELPKQLYPKLYALIGSTWGETESTFFLPDLQGQFVRGWDREQNVDPEREFGSPQCDTIQGHSHNLKYTKSIRTSSDGSHKHRVYYNSHKAVTSVGGLGNTEDDYSFWEVYGSSLSDDAKTESDGVHNHSIDLPIINVLDPKSSSCQVIRFGIETRPKNVALMFCIKVK